MDELKVELLKIGKEKGDSGDTELQKTWINTYLEALQQYLTPEGIRSFTPLDIRCLYILWLNEYLRTGSLTAASQLILSHLELSMEPRQLVKARSTDPNVVSIFERKA